MSMLLFTLLAAAQTPSAPQKNQPASNIEKSTSKAKENPHPVIQESLQNGRYIRLSDNSLWEINPSDRPITQSWITPVEIVAEPSDNTTYPFRLTNTLTKSSVLARRATAIAKPVPMPAKPAQK